MRPDAIRRRFGPAMLAAALAIVLDQSTKWLMVEIVMRSTRRIEVLPFFDLVLAFNPGISFGMLRGTLEHFPEALSLVKLGIVAVLVWLLARNDDRWERVALGLMIGGALGNIADRLRIGAVVDFLDFHVAGWHWPSFNLADSALSIGLVIFLARSFRERVEPRHEQREH